MCESLEDLLDKAEKGEIPSPFGKMEFKIMGSPSSIQSKKQVKNAYKKSITNLFKSYKFILTGDIIMNISWFIPAKSRYETDASADIDNCLKPIIDSFAGPNGLFIDDCQVGGLYIAWHHIESGDEYLNVEIEFGPDDYYEKKDLAFVRLEKGICSLVNISWPKKVRKIMYKFFREQQQNKTKFEELGAPYLSLAPFLGNIRPFHITRVQEFDVYSLKDFKNKS